MGATIRLLGRVEVEVDGRRVEPRSAKERALLARLALDPGAVVATERLAEALWPDGDAPDDPGRAVRYHVWRLRGILEPDRPARSDGALVLTAPTGYRLAVAPADVDAVRVEADWSALGATSDPAARRAALGQMLDGWGRPAFADPDERGPLGAAAARLERLRAAASAERVAADLELGLGAELVPELERLVAEHRFDERLRGQLMVALYRAGRQTDALAVGTATRSLLVEELGVEPGRELRDLEARILRHDPSLTAGRPEAVAPAATAGRLGAVTPASTPGPAARTNLPHPVDSFVGRDGDLAEVVELLAHHRLVTLTGAGGIGKTRLATEAARTLVDAHPDGAWIAELAPVVDEALVTTVVAETWGLITGERGAEDVVVSFLRERRLLLVLDNCEHVLGAARAFAARALREAPGVRILATSRESLGVAGEVSVRVPGLGSGTAPDGPSAAAELFVDRGRAARPSWRPDGAELAVVERICARLDGIPLGVELTAPRLRSMTPAEIAEHLDEALGVLNVSAKHAPARHQTLAATVEWSYHLLSETERRVFRRAALFAGGFDAAAARDVCAPPAGTVTDVLDSLVDKSLVLATPGPFGTRFRLLEPVRQWARARLDDAAEADEVRIAHARHYAGLVARLAPDHHRRGQAAALERTAADYANIRIALATLLETGDHDRLLATAFGLFSHWAHHSMHVEALDTCRRALAAAADHPDLAARVRTGVVGAICGAWTRRSAAATVAHDTLALAERLGDVHAHAWAELAVAVVSGNDGMPRGVGEAVADPDTNGHMARSAELWDARPDRSVAWWDPEWEEGLQQLCRSIFLPYEPARFAEFRASEAAFRAVGDEGWLTILYCQTLEQLEFAGVEEVRRLLELGAAYRISPSWTNSARSRLGVLHIRLGEYEEAIEPLRRALRFARSGGQNWAGEARFLAAALVEAGRTAEATELLDAVFAEVARDRGERETLRTLVASSRALLANGHVELAALALGHAGPFQDNYLDTIGTVRARLVAHFGEARTVELLARGASADRTALVAEVRAALRSAGRPLP